MNARSDSSTCPGANPPAPGIFGVSPTPMIDRSTILARNAGLLIRPPAMTPTNHFPDGPLLGNGDMTIVASGPGDLQTFHIGKSDFWTDGVGYQMTNEEYDHYVVSPITVGSVRLWVRDFAIPTYRHDIDIERAELRGTFDTQQIQLKTRVCCAAHENLMIIELRLASPSAVGFHLRVEAKGNDDPNVAQLPTASGVEPDGIAWATRQTWDLGRWVSRACLALKVLDRETGRI